MKTSKTESSLVCVKTKFKALKIRSKFILTLKSKYSLIKRITLSLRKKNYTLTIPPLMWQDDKKNQPKSTKFGAKKLFQVRKRYDLYHALANEVRLFEAEYFFRFIR